MRTVLLDLDGTLTDPFEGISKCIMWRADKTELLDHIIEHQHLIPEQCDMIGDREQDMVAACNHAAIAVDKRQQ